MSFAPLSDLPLSDTPDDGGAVAYTWAIDPTSYATTFADPTFVRSRIWAVDPTSYSTTFADPTFVRSRIWSVDPTSYSTTFADPTFVRSRIWSVDPTSYSTTFADPTFVRSRIWSVDPTSYSTTFADPTFEYISSTPTSIPSPGVFGGAGKLTGHVGRGYSDKPRLSQLSEIRARIQREDEEILALLVAVVQSGVLNGRRY